jgi:hypothetical protein
MTISATSRQRSNNRQTTNRHPGSDHLLTTSPQVGNSRQEMTIQPTNSHRDSHRDSRTSNHPANQAINRPAGQMSNHLAG